MIPEPVRIGQATLYLGDAYEILPSIKADALVTDPPYKMDSKGAGKFRRSRYYMERIEQDGLDKGFDMSIINAAQFPSIKVFAHTNQIPDLLNRAARDYDRFALLTWHKTNAMPVANRNYRPDTEYIVHAWKKDHYPVGRLDQLSRYILSPIRKNRFGHGTVKPIEVMDYLVANMQAKTICDPFMGTGSTGIAAILNQRTFIGIEKNPRWFKIACERLTEFQNNKGQ